MSDKSGSNKSGSGKQPTNSKAEPKKPAQGKAEPTKSEKAKPEQGKPQPSKAGQSKAEQSKPQTGKPETGKPDEKKAATATTAGKQTDKAKPAEKAPSKEQSVEKPAAAPPTKPVKQDKEARPSKAPMIVACLALLIAVFAIGAAVYVWSVASERLHQAELDAAKRASATEITSKQTVENEQALQAVNKDVLSLKGGVQTLGIKVDSHSAFKTRIDQTESQQRVTLEKIAALQGGLNKLRDHVGSSEGAWVVAEIEYLLQIGYQRLILTNDVQVAHVALTTAEQRLNDLSDPAFLPVRRILSKEIAELEKAKAKQPDLHAMTIALSTNIGVAEGLPVKDEMKPTQLAEGSVDASMSKGPDKSFVDDVGNKFHNLFNFRYSKVGDTYQPPVTPRRSSFVKQNLVLKLEAARIGLLRQNEAAYKASLDAAVEWLDNWFDTNDAGVKKMQADLGVLRNKTIRTEIPNISESLRKLRTIKQQITMQRLKRQAEENGAAQ